MDCYTPTLRVIGNDTFLLFLMCLQLYLFDFLMCFTNSVLYDVGANHFFFERHTQAYGNIDQLEAHKRHGYGPGTHRQHCKALDAELMQTATLIVDAN